jgi:hypothetical protein
MKNLNILITVLFGCASAAWSPFSPTKPKPRSTAHNYGKPRCSCVTSMSLMILDDVEVDSGNFNPGDLLDPKTPKSETYMLARAGLQNIGKESSCHRIAARLYMSNCQLLEDFEKHGESSMSTQIGDRLQDYIDSFAASLAICDLQSAYAEIAESCELFREPTLQDVITTNGVHGLHVSHEQIGQCMKGLHSNQNSWTSFNSNKDTATLLCRVARTEVERGDIPPYRS